MDDKLSRIAGMLCDILRVANDQIATAGPDRYLIQDMELISGLLRREYRPVSNLAKDATLGIDEKWRQCDYIFHALFWGLRDKVPFKILQNVSDERVLFLQDAMDFAKNRERPGDDVVAVASALGAEYARKNSDKKINDFKKIQNNIIRFSAYITVTVSKHWDDMVEELNRWSDYIDERVAVASIAGVGKTQKPSLSIDTIQRYPGMGSGGRESGEKPVHNQENTEVIGQPVSVEQTPVVEQPVQIERKPVVERVVAQKQPVEKPLSMPKENNTNESGIIHDDKGNELWSIEYLAKKMGYKDVNSVYVKKTLYLKKHPDEDTKKFFEKSFVYTHDGKKRAWFVAEYFEELKQYIPPVNKNVRPDEIVKDKNGKELWKSEKLAKMLGFNSTGYFLSQKCELKKQNPDIDKWFVRVGSAVYFYPEYFEDLKALLQPLVTVREQVIKDEDNKELWSTAKIVAELGLPSEMCFFNRKSRLLKRNPEIENYFVRKGNVVYFKAENFDEFKKLLEEMGNRSYQSKESIADKKTFKQKGSGKQPVVVGGGTGDKGDEKQIVDVPIVVEQPKDFVGVTSFQTFLNALQELLEHQTQMEQDAKAAYVVAQEQREKTQKLFDDVKFAGQNLQVAQKYYNETCVELEQFLVSNNLLEK